MNNQALKKDKEPTEEFNSNELKLRELESKQVELKQVEIAGAGSVPRLDIFDLERKQAFLSLLLQHWPHVYKVCDEIGIHPQTYYNHLKSDEWFRGQVLEAKARRLERIEAVAVESAENPTKGFLDRAMILRAYMPDRYDRAKVVKIEGYKMAEGERSQRLGAVDAVIDAEIVKTYADRKQRQELKQQARLAGGEGQAGEKAGGTA